MRINQFHEKIALFLKHIAHFLASSEISFDVLLIMSISVTKEVLELRDKLDSAYARIAEGDQIAAKAATLSEENANLKSKLDEVSSEKLVAEEKMHLLETVLSERYYNVLIIILKKIKLVF